MDQHKVNTNDDRDDFQFIELQSSMWPRVILYGFCCLIAVLLIAFTAYEIDTITMEFIGGQAPSPDVFMVLALVAIALLLQLA